MSYIRSGADSWKCRGGPVRSEWGPIYEAFYWCPTGRGFGRQARLAVQFCLKVHVHAIARFCPKKQNEKKGAQLNWILKTLLNIEFEAWVNIFDMRLQCLINSTPRHNLYNLVLLLKCGLAFDLRETVETLLLKKYGLSKFGYWLQTVVPQSLNLDYNQV